MIKKLLLLVCCALLVGECAPSRRKLIFPPVSEGQPETGGIDPVKVLLLGEDFSVVLPRDPEAQLDWEVIWDKKVLAGSQSQETMCSDDENGSCLKVVKCKFKATQVGEALIEFRLKERGSVVESFSSRIIVTDDDAHKRDEIPRIPVN